MTRVLRTDFAAVNGAGVTVRTFNDAAFGRAWVRDNAFLHDGLTLEEVQITARRVYRPRTISRARDFAIPAIPAAA